VYRCEILPEYFDLVKDSKEDHQNDKLKRLWEYLLRLEPVMDAETYVQCFREVGDSYGRIRHLWPMLDLLPAEKRVKVLEGLKKELTPELLKNNSNKPSDEHEINRIKRIIDEAIADSDPAKSVEYLLNDEQRGVTNSRTQKWLTKARPGHVIAEIIAQSDDVKLRQISIDLLAGHPTPPRLELLSKLAADDDKQVSQAAENAIDELDHFKNNIEVLRSGSSGKAYETIIAEASKATQVQIRFYKDLKPGSEYTTASQPIGVNYMAEGLKRDGSVNLSAVRVESDSLDTADWPDKGYAVFCGTDQKSAVVRKILGKNIQVWPLPFDKPKLNWQGSSELLLLCDAAGNPIADTPLTVEMKKHRSQEKIWVTGWKSDADGMLHSPKVQGRYTFWGYLFDHPDYGKVRVDRNGLHRKKEIVVPLLKAGAKEYDRALFGTVVDPNDIPVAGAKVEITGIWRDTHMRSNTVGKTVYTDKNGWFTFYPYGQHKGTKIPAMGKYGLRITAPKNLNRRRGQKHKPLNASADLTTQRC